MVVSKEIRDDIDRLIEQFQLEGRSILELPEQLAAALMVGVCRKKAEPPMVRTDYNDEDYSMEELYNLTGGHGIWKELLEEVTIVKSRQLRRELLRFAQRLLRECPGLTPADFSSLGEVMECLLDGIFRRGNKSCFFTPVNIARFMIRLVQPGGGTLWDPACGSGVFLVEAVQSTKEGDCLPDLFGTDINEQMRRIARLNAFFHGIRSARIVAEDALEEQRKFDVIVANPPVSAGQRNDRLYGNIVPTAAPHLQYLQMIPEHLMPGGRAAVLVNESVLFSTRRTETKIRKALVEHYGLRAVISLPRGAFAPYTNGKSSILLFGGRQEPQEEILFYELHHLGYTLDSKHLETEENDIPGALAVCAESDIFYEKWNAAVWRAKDFNADGILVPEDWQEDYWFADSGTVRENGYVLLPDRYCPRRREEREEQEDYRELLDRLFCLEQEAGEQLEKLRDIFQRNWI